MRLRKQCQCSFREVCSRYNFIYTPKFTAMQNCHIIAKHQSKSAITCTLNFSFYQLLIKISSVLSNQKLVMQPFDLYNYYGTLITKFLLLNFPFRALRLHLSSHSSPFFFPPLTTQEPTHQHPAQFVPFFFEVLGPDTLETVICLASSSSSSELVTISSHAFSC